MIQYDLEILKVLKESPFVAQGAVGDPPKQWASEMGISYDYDLPNYVLTRQQIRTYCQDHNTDVLQGYIMSMAWGAQGKGPGGKRNVQKAWAQKEEIREKISEIKLGNISRIDAYDLFCNNGEIAGIGPAYFTKLLYFFNPNPTMYIMDQWTTKPVILLTGKNIIRHSNDGPTRANTGENYELFCRIVEDLSKRIDADDGEEVEQRLFSVGQIRRQPRGPFRQFVFDKWAERPNLGRYNHDEVINALQQLPA
jgi:hypothetical protein